MTAPRTSLPAVSMAELTAAYVAAGTTGDARKERRVAASRFITEFGDVARWAARSSTDRMAAVPSVRAFAAFAAVHAHRSVDASYVVAAASKWGRHVADRDSAQAGQFRFQASSLGFDRLEVDKMWSKLAQICVITGTTPDTLTTQEYLAGREQFRAAVTARRGQPPKSLTTPLFGLDAVMFHRGQAPRPAARAPWRAHSVPEIGWDQIREAAPIMAATMRRYLDQLAVSLRASSVACIEITLRQFAGHVVATSDVVTIADVDRAHVESYKTWLAGRGGYRKNTHVSKTTIGMRMGHLSAFFGRIIEWDYPDIPRRAPVYASDRPIKDKPLPRFLDDASTAKFMAAARALPDQFGRLAIEILARTGMRKGELLGLTIDAVVQIGSAYWLRIPLGKLHNDRYIPLHPQLKTMIDSWLAATAGLASQRPAVHRPRPPHPGHPGRPGRPSRRHRRRHRPRPPTPAAAHPGHPGHQPRHEPGSDRRPARPQDHDHDPGLRPDRRPHRRRPVLRRHREGRGPLPAAATRRPAGHATNPPSMRSLRAEHQRRMLGNGYCARPVELDCHYETICESCTFFVTTIEFRPTLQAQRDDAAHKGQTGRQKIYDGLLQRLDNTGT